MSDEPKLLPCPFCGGVAEQDYQQPYRSISAGNLGKACAVYCTTCSASMDLCHEDHGGVSPDDLMSELVAAWNTRAAPPGMIRLDAPELLAVIERLRAADGYIAKGHYEMARNLTRYAITAWEKLTK